MKNTTYEEVIESFESTFQDKVIIPDSLAEVWFLKAVGRYSKELDPLIYDKELKQFNAELDRYVIDHLGSMMKQYYQERELSKVNKRVSIVGKDVSIDGSNGAKTATKNELDYVVSEVDEMTQNQMPTAYV